MDIRKRLAENQKATSIAAVLVCVIAIAYCYLQIRPERLSASNTYYTDDDGKTFFAGDGGQAKELQSRNKPAYVAAVFRQNATGSLTVGYLARTEPDAVKRLDQAKRAADAARSSLKPADPKVAACVEAWIQAQSAMQSSTQVKKPLGGAWVAMNSEAGQQLVKSMKENPEFLAVAP